MKVLIAPDSYKESLTAKEVADAIEAGWKVVLPQTECIKIPMADGGEGTVQSLVDATNGRLVYTKVTSPLGEPVKAFYGILGDQNTAIIEMSAASGLHQVPLTKRNPLITTTRGTGELILHAINQKVDKIMIGLGGSATNDAGAGMAKALGYQFLDRQGNEIIEGGAGLIDCHRIDDSKVDERIKTIQFEVACDVENPLIGVNGASIVYGPQKGATSDMVEKLECSLAHFAKIIEKDLGVSVANEKGAGAAGGMGAGALAFLNANLKKGFQLVSEAVSLEKYIKEVELVITGEGKIDGQSIYGKTPIGVASLAKKYQLPVLVIAGSIGKGYELVYKNGIDAVFPILPSISSVEEALLNGRQNIERTASEIAKIWKIANDKMGKM
ncbi:glycerate kinase [Bacillus sp. RG28]|uniref:Glycerate kinase n=1 Tax=Gottfriedia endophytica TaxID=2820819 RepID=A0A940NQE7_9BACI|nr:glycerate kinase [Gottfriedia endophytica]MBP0724976.1 glycerate kinase [Gottfriedia endophytica]